MREFKLKAVKKKFITAQATDGNDALTVLPISLRKQTVAKWDYPLSVRFYLFGEHLHTRTPPMFLVDLLLNRTSAVFPRRSPSRRRLFLWVATCSSSSGITFHMHKNLNPRIHIWETKWLPVFQKVITFKIPLWGIILALRRDQRHDSYTLANISEGMRNLTKKKKPPPEGASLIIW